MAICSNSRAPPPHRQQNLLAMGGGVRHTYSLSVYLCSLKTYRCGPRGFLVNLSMENNFASGFNLARHCLHLQT